MTQFFQFIPEASATSGGTFINGDQTLPPGVKTFSGSVAIPGTTSGQNPTSWIGKDSGNCMFVDNSFGTALGSSANVAIIIDSSNASTTRTFSVRHNSKNTGAAAVFTVDESGLADATGTVRATGNAAPASGLGAEVAVLSGTTAAYFGYNRGTGAFIPTVVDGLSVGLRPSGSNMLICTTTGTTHSGAQAYKVTTVTGAGPTTVSGSDHHVAWNPTVSAAGQINLPASPFTGQEFVMQDIKGIAAANNLTISGNGKNINGGTTATTEVIATNNGGRIFWYDGTQWNIKAKF